MVFAMWEHKNQKTQWKHEFWAHVLHKWLVLLKETYGFCSPDLPELQIALPTLRLGLFQLGLKTKKTQRPNENLCFLKHETK